MFSGVAGAGPVHGLGKVNITLCAQHRHVYHCECTFGLAVQLRWSQVWCWSEKYCNTVLVGRVGMILSGCAVQAYAEVILLVVVRENSFYFII